MLQTCGIQVTNTKPPIVTPPSGQGQPPPPVKTVLMQAGKTAFQSSNKVPPQLIRIILPDRGKTFYEEVKKTAMMDLPVRRASLCRS